MASRSPNTYTYDLPPREPSPEPVITPLPSPALRSQRSRQRLRLLSNTPDSPPIPPTLIGSPLLNMCAPRKRTISLNPDACPDDFGARRRPRPEASLPSPPQEPERRQPRVLHRRTSSISISANCPARVNARSRSPPPMPRRQSIAPPVPPIPDFVRAGAQKAALQPRHVLDEPVPSIRLSPAAHDSRPSAQLASREGMTCLQYLTMHNHPQPASVRAH